MLQGGAALVVAQAEVPAASLAAGASCWVKSAKDWQCVVMRFITSGKRVDFTVGWWPLQLCSRGWLCHQGALWEPDHYLMTPVQAVSASTPRSLSVSCCSAAGSLHIDKADAQAAG